MTNHVLQLGSTAKYFLLRQTANHPNYQLETTVIDLSRRALSASPCQPFAKSRDMSIPYKYLSINTFIK
jgi:hypothetical protein